MDLMEAIKERHSVRDYTDKKIEGKVEVELRGCIKQCNKESGLHIQLVLNEPKAFDGIMAHYGNFKGVQNYIAVVGKKGDNINELCGYYGEKVVLRAQQLGLNTCWVALTFSKIKDAFQVENDEKLYLVIAIGYGTSNGIPHKSKKREDVVQGEAHMPEWFLNGVDAALLAPTATNQQRFTFSLDGNRVSAKAGIAFYSKLDLGIVKYHFEIGAGVENFIWA